MSPHCQNCGSFVTKDYVRVFGIDGEDDPRACPAQECDMEWNTGVGAFSGGGPVRQSKSYQRGDHHGPGQRVSFD